MQIQLNHASVCRISIFLLLVSISVTGCGPRGDFSVAQARGTIKTADGTPLQSGIITFTPIPKSEKAKGGKPAYAKIVDGKFEMTTYGNKDGAVVGSHTVSLTESKRPDDESVNKREIPPKHNCEIADESRTVEVKSEGSTFELVAVTKKQKRRRRGDDEDDD